MCILKGFFDWFYFTMFLLGNENSKIQIYISRYKIEIHKYSKQQVYTLMNLRETMRRMQMNYLSRSLPVIFWRPNICSNSDEYTSCNDKSKRKVHVIRWKCGNIMFSWTLKYNHTINK